MKHIKPQTKQRLEKITEWGVATGIAIPCVYGLTKELAKSIYFTGGCGLIIIGTQMAVLSYNNSEKIREFIKRNY